MRAIFAEISRFRRERSGNIAVIFMLALLPILSAVGCAIDYSSAAQLRSKFAGRG
jgi:Flp pilus assembly protein TadG